MLYLPVDESAGAPAVSDEVNVKGTLLETVKELTALRHRYEDLQADALFRPLYAKKGDPFVYERGNMVLAVYPDSETRTVETAEIKGKKAVYSIGQVSSDDDRLKMEGPSFVVLI